jgi:hypothetical protein
MNHRRVSACFVAVAVALGCSSDRVGIPKSGVADGLQYPASVAPSSQKVGSLTIPVVVATLTLKNTSGDSQHVQGSVGCPSGGPTTVRVYTAGSRRLVWNSSLYLPDAICAAVGIDRTIARGDTMDVAAPYALSAIIGDSIPTGRYLFTLTPDRVSPALHTELDAGTLTLSR